jgi:hypothetical protein
MSEIYGSVRQMPCPDCGYPVQPDRDQLCPNCGYPLMFLRKSAGDNDARAQSIPRSPNERDDMTGLRGAPPVPQPRVETRQFQPGTYGVPPQGQVQCRSCGYPNDPARIRCERCGFELRTARPRGTQLAPAVYAQQPARGGVSIWLILLIILAVVALVLLALTLLWVYLG